MEAAALKTRDKEDSNEPKQMKEETQELSVKPRSLWAGARLIRVGTV